MKNELQLSTLKTLSDMGRYVPAMIVPAIMGLVSVSLFTRILSPYEYGLYILVFTAVLFIDVFAFSWLNQSTLRYFEKYKTLELAKFVSTVFISFIASMVIVTIIWFFCLYILDSRIDQRLWKLSFLGPLLVFTQSGYKLVLTYLRAKRESKRYSLHSVANSILKLTMALLLIYYCGMNAEGILLGIALAAGLTFFSETLRITKRCGMKTGKFSLVIFTSLTRYGFPLIGLAAANMILSLSDRYIIEYFIGSAEVGIYSAGYRIAEMSVYLLISFLLLAAFPVLIEVYENKGEIEARALMKDLFNIYLLFIVPVVFGICALAEELTSVLLGSSYYKAHIILPWVSAGIFFMGVSMYYNKSFELKEKTVKLFYILIFSSFLNLLLNILIIPIYGILGAAIATCISYFFNLILTLFFGSKYLKWEFPWKIFFKILTYSIFMYSVISIIPAFSSNIISLCSKILIGFATYTFLLAVFEKKLLFLFFGFINSKASHNKILD
jgi:O-antigen/teichoic acid export membrane protein